MRRTWQVSDARRRRHLAAACRRASRRFRAGGRSALGMVRRTAAHMGARRGRSRAAVAVGAGRLRRGHRALFHRAARANPLGHDRRGDRVLRYRVSRTPRPLLCRRRHGGGGRVRLCDRDLEDGTDRARRAGAAAHVGDAVGLRRDPRHPRAHRPLRAARGADGCAADARKTGARAALGEEGHRARCRQLCRAEGAAVAAARTVAAGLLRFRPRPVLPGDRRVRLRDGRDPHRRAARQWRFEAALRRLHAGPARYDRCPHSQPARRRRARDCDRAAHRPPRRHLPARQRRHVHLRARPRAVDLRLSHGGRRRRGVLCGARAAGADPRADRELLRSRNGRPRWRWWPQPFICCCRAPRSPPNARSS